MTKAQAQRGADLAHLAFYRAKPSHGRGRITGSSHRLLKAGYLRLTWTGFYTHILSLTAKGELALDEREMDGLEAVVDGAA